MQMESRPRGRSRKIVPEIQAEALPEEVEVRLGMRPVMTSKGPSDGTHRTVLPGSTVLLPRHEAENLVEMGYAIHV